MCRYATERTFRLSQTLYTVRHSNWSTALRQAFFFFLLIMVGGRKIEGIFQNVGV
jgi:hypothetical protein